MNEALYRPARVTITVDLPAEPRDGGEPMPPRLVAITGPTQDARVRRLLARLVEPSEIRRLLVTA